jgi:hypothetical protein
LRERDKEEKHDGILGNSIVIDFFCRLDHDDKYVEQVFEYGLPGIFVERLACLGCMCLESIIPMTQ